MKKIFSLLVAMLMGLVGTYAADYTSTGNFSTNLDAPFLGGTTSGTVTLELTKNGDNFDIAFNGSVKMGSATNVSFSASNVALSDGKLETTSVTGKANSSNLFTTGNLTITLGDATTISLTAQIEGYNYTYTVTDGTKIEFGGEPEPTGITVRDGKTYTIADAAEGGRYWNGTVITSGNITSSETPGKFTVARNENTVTLAIVGTTQFVGAERWNVVPNDAAFNWTIAETEDNTYSLYQNTTANAGYAGGQGKDDHKLYCDNKTAVALTFAPVFKLTYKFVDAQGTTVADDQVAYLNAGDAYPAYTLPEGGTYVSGAPEDGKTVANADADDEVYTIVVDGLSAKTYAVTYTVEGQDEEADMFQIGAETDPEEGYAPFESGAEFVEGTSIMINALTTDPQRVVTVKVNGEEVALVDAQYEFKTAAAETTISVVFEKNVLTVEEGHTYYIKEAKSGLFVSMVDPNDGTPCLRKDVGACVMTVAGKGALWSFKNEDGTYLNCTHGWNATITEAEYQWTIAGSNEAFTIQRTGATKYINLDAFEEGAKLYTDKASGATFQLIDAATYDPLADIKATITAITEGVADNIGTNPGYYEKTAAEAAVAKANAAVEDASATVGSLEEAKTTLETELAAAVIYPVVGKNYKFQVYSYYLSCTESETENRIVMERDTEEGNQNIIWTVGEENTLIPVTNTEARLTSTYAQAGQLSMNQDLNTVNMNFEFVDIASHKFLLNFGTSTSARYAYGASSNVDAGGSANQEGYKWTITEVETEEPEPQVQKAQIVVALGNTKDERFSIKTELANCNGWESDTFKDGNKLSITQDPANTGKFWNAQPIAGTWENEEALMELAEFTDVALTAADMSEGSALKAAANSNGAVNAILNFVLNAQKKGDKFTAYVTAYGWGCPLDELTVTGLDNLAVAYATNDGTGFSSEAVFTQTLQGLNIFKITGTLAADAQVVSVTSPTTYVNNETTYKTKIGFQLAAYAVEAGEEPEPEPEGVKLNMYEAEFTPGTDDSPYWTISWDDKDSYYIFLTPDQAVSDPVGTYTLSDLFQDNSYGICFYSYADSEYKTITAINITVTCENEVYTLNGTMTAGGVDYILFMTSAKNPSTGLSTVTSKVTPVDGTFANGRNVFIQNGKVVIVRGGKFYNTNGQAVR